MFSPSVAEWNDALVTVPAALSAPLADGESRITNRATQPASTGVSRVLIEASLVCGRRDPGVTSEKVF